MSKQKTSLTTYKARCLGPLCKGAPVTHVASDNTVWCKACGERATAIRYGGELTIKPLHDPFLELRDELLEVRSTRNGDRELTEYLASKAILKHFKSEGYVDIAEAFAACMGMTP